MGNSRRCRLGSCDSLEQGKRIYGKKHGCKYGNVALERVFSEYAKFLDRVKDRGIGRFRDSYIRLVDTEFHKKMKPYFSQCCDS